MGGWQVMMLGSLFDGIGGWLIAAKHAGVKPVWASEVDPFPAAVTAYHFPEVTQLGDITQIDVYDLEPVDIICAGSPCQDLSVAGKREGLEGERSGLFHTAIRLVHELRARTGDPRYFVWENVPGAFSSNKGLDFRAVLEEISETEIPMPKDNKWAPAGMVEWDGGSIAWRVLDAQYWGVPQRRKRIFLVADFGGQSAGEILFERKSLSGNTQAGGAEEKGIASATHVDFGETGGRAAHPINLQIATRHKALGRGTGFGVGNSGDPAYTLEAEHSHGVAVYDMTHADEVLRPVEGGKSNTLNARMGTGGNQVPVVFALEGNGARPSHNGDGWSGDWKSFTLNTIERHAVAVDVNFYTRQSISEFKETVAASALKARDYKDYTDVVTANKSVRRLTPTECERLQGLPDGYTGIEYKGKPAPDSKRYKALGNGMAQPVADWVIKRIVDKEYETIRNEH